MHVCLVGLVELGSTSEQALLEMSLPCESDQETWGRIRRCSDMFATQSCERTLSERRPIGFLAELRILTLRGMTLHIQSAIQGFFHLEVLLLALLIGLCYLQLPMTLTGASRRYEYVCSNVLLY